MTEGLKQEKKPENDPFYYPPMEKMKVEQLTERIQSFEAYIDELKRGFKGIERDLEEPRPTLEEDELRKKLESYRKHILATKAERQIYCDEYFKRTGNIYKIEPETYRPTGLHFGLKDGSDQQ